MIRRLILLLVLSCIMLLGFAILFFFYCDGDHRELNVLTHSFPPRRSSELEGKWPVAALQRADTSRCHNASTRCSMAGSGVIGWLQVRLVSPGHLWVASSPSFEPRPGTGLAKSR